MVRAMPAFCQATRDSNSCFEMSPMAPRRKKHHALAPRGRAKNTSMQLGWGGVLHWVMGSKLNPKL